MHSIAEQFLFLCVSELSSELAWASPRLQDSPYMATRGQVCALQGHGEVVAAVLVPSDPLPR